MNATDSNFTPTEVVGSEAAGCVRRGAAHTYKNTWATQTKGINCRVFSTVMNSMSGE